MMKIIFDYVFEMVKFEFYFEFNVKVGKKIIVIFVVKIVDGVIFIFELINNILSSVNLVLGDDVF